MYKIHFQAFVSPEYNMWNCERNYFLNASGALLKWNLELTIPSMNMSLNISALFCQDNDKKSISPMGIPINASVHDDATLTICNMLVTYFVHIHYSYVISDLRGVLMFHNLNKF